MTVDIEGLERLAGLLSERSTHWKRCSGWYAGLTYYSSGDSALDDECAQAILSLIERVRELEDKITEVPTICRRYESRVARLEGLLREAQRYAAILPEEDPPGSDRLDLLDRIDVALSETEKKHDA